MESRVIERTKGLEAYEPDLLLGVIFRAQVDDSKLEEVLELIARGQARP